MDRCKKIGVIGLGLIGGSLFKALCALGCNVYAVSKSSSTLKKAKKYSNNVSDNLESLIGSDFIFVCTPMNKTLQILGNLDKILNKTTIVIDTCSLKGFITGQKYNFKFIPSHPMAGTEFSGFDSSFEALFQGAKWVITPLKNTMKSDVKKVVDIVEALGASAVVTTAQEHDEAVALISHMPMLVAQGLFKTAQENKLALKIASSGFRDMTRLALSNEEMANDMIDMNSSNIQKALLKLYASIGNLLNDDYAVQIKKIKSKRDVMYKNGVNVQ